MSGGAGRSDQAGFMQTVIVVIHLMVVAAMVGVVLLQKSEGGGLGIGSTGGFLSSRGSANILTRATAVLAAVFFGTSLLLSALAGWDRKPHSIIEQTQAPPAPQAPGVPTGPVTPPGQGGGLLDTLRRNEQQPPAPPAPGPQVPRPE
jgi:preprotein translocase subunit SecG